MNCGAGLMNFLSARGSSPPSHVGSETPGFHVVDVIYF